MEKFIDKCVLLICCFFLLLQSESGSTLVIVLYIGITLLALTSLLEESNMKKYIWLCYVGLCVLYPFFLFLLPILLYDCFNKQKWVIGLGVLVVGFQWDYIMDDSTSIYFIPLSIVAVIISIRTTKLLTYQKTYHEVRDFGVEQKIEFQRKNEALMEKQDYEVHLATLQERTRIAREIHDNVGHMLTRSILQMGALSTIRKEEPLHSQLLQINENLNQAMNSIRESIHDLHNEGMDLEWAVREATRAMEDRFKIDVQYDMSKSMDKKVKYCFIAVIKEALANIIKHSNGNEVRIVLREHPGMYQLSIWDNGCANTPIKRNVKQAEEGNGIGIYSMKERVEQLHGNFSVEWKEGFKIFISVPKESKESFR